jgi:hypothetical protein
LRTNDPEAAGRRFYTPTGREVPLYVVPKAASAAAATLRAAWAVAPLPAGTAPVIPSWCPPPPGLMNVLYVVEAVLGVLERLTAGVTSALTQSRADFNKGRVLLESNTAALLGPGRDGRAVRIMVTMPMTRRTTTRSCASSEPRNGRHADQLRARHARGRRR